jgi:iron complex transport system substrate-binding protein
VYQIQAEQIVAFDPEVILLGDAAYGVTVEAVGLRPGWEVLSAVKSGDVRPIDDVIVTRPGPRLADGIRALALAIHPDLVLPSAAP